MGDFADSLHKVFARLGCIHTRRMFGGYGIHHEDRMIGLVARDVLYLKADAETAAYFDTLQLPALTFERSGKPMQMSYRKAPADIFDDPERAALWGRRAWEAAMRTGQPPRTRTAKQARKT